MLNKEAKTDIVAKFQRDGKDTGSTEVQVALLSTRIAELTEHLKANPNDNHSRLGLVKMVSKRKKLLKYYAEKDLEACRKLKSELKIR